MPNSSRMIYIQLLPRRLRLSIIQKMNMVQVYRLRRTCKQMNNFITSIQSECSNYTTTTLCICLSGFSLSNDVDGLIYVGGKNLNPRSPYCFCFSSSSSSLLMGQLIGVRFRRILLQRNGFHQTFEHRCRMLFQKLSEPIDIMNILRTLNLQCEEIHCMDMLHGEIPWDIMRLIRFTTQILSEIKQRRVDVLRIQKLTASINDYDTSFRDFRAVSIKKMRLESTHSILFKYIQKILKTKDHGRLEKLSIPFNVNDVKLLDEFPWKQIYRTPVGPIKQRRFERINCLIVLMKLSEEEVIVIINKETIYSMGNVTARCKILFIRNNKVEVTRKVLDNFTEGCIEEDKRLAEQIIRTIASKEWEDQQDCYQQLLDELNSGFG